MQSNLVESHIYMNKQKFIEKVLISVEALLTLKEAELLLSLPQNIPANGVIVEIGSYKGGSTILLAHGSKIAKRGKLYAIDPFGAYHNSASILPIFLKNIKKFGMQDQVIPIVKTSLWAARNWKRPISLLWIDGDHQYSHVKADFLLWEKHLVKGGLIAFHDSQKVTVRIPSLDAEVNFNKKGPIRVVKEYVVDSKRFSNIKIVDSITVAQKIEGSIYEKSIKNKAGPSWFRVFVYLYCIQLYRKMHRAVKLFGVFLLRLNPRLYFLIKKLKK